MRSMSQMTQYCYINYLKVGVQIRQNIHQNPGTFFVEVDKMLLKYIKKYKCYIIEQSVNSIDLKKKNKLGGLTSPDFKITVIQSMWSQ